MRRMQEVRRFARTPGQQAFKPRPLTTAPRRALVLSRPPTAVGGKAGAPGSEAAIVKRLTHFTHNPPHTLHAALQPILPWLATELAQFDGARSALERSPAA